MLLLLVAVTAAQALKSGSLLTPDRSVYPATARAAHVTGTSTIIFGVGPERHYAGCEIAHSSGSTELDMASCAAVQARLLGLTSPKGKPLKLKVQWLISNAPEIEVDFDGAIPIDINSWLVSGDYPPSAWLHDRAGSSKILFDIKADGSVDNCRIREGSGSPDLDYMACYSFVSRGAFLPAVDASGVPRLAHGSTTVRWRVDGARRLAPATRTPAAN